MRNIHLGLGLIFVLMALVFAVSSLVIIYRPWIETKPRVSESTAQISLEAVANPRVAARELMADNSLKGDLRQIQEDGDVVSFRIVRPGEAVEVEYGRSKGEAKIKVRRHGLWRLWSSFIPTMVCGTSTRPRTSGRRSRC
jgi:hypothetical protein